MQTISNALNQTLDFHQLFKANEVAWDLISPMHKTSDFYDIEKFLNKPNSLHEIEIKNLGDVRGKKILHLQSHIGNDSISLANLGAYVTAVDFSIEAIRIGKELSQQVGKEVIFVHSNVLDIDFENEFDIVFLSYGALCWIPNLEEYFKLIYKNLKKGGVFYFVDFHQNLLCYDTLTNKRKYQLTMPEEPIHEYRTGSYAATENDKEYEVYYWIHSVSDIVNSLLSAGFNLNKIEEFDYLPFDCFPGLEQDNKKWKFKGNLKGLPLLISAKSYK